VNREGIGPKGCKVPKKTCGSNLDKKIPGENRRSHSGSSVNFERSLKTGRLAQGLLSRQSGRLRQFVNGNMFIRPRNSRRVVISMHCNLECW
jgi:hypothetical protein